MSLFQLGGLLLIGFLMLLSLAALARRWLGPGLGVLYFVFWTLAAVAFVRPELTKKVANTLGVGRGTDLVLYLVVFAAAVGFFALLIRLHRLEANMTKIIRYLALRDAVVPREDGAGSGQNQPREADPGEGS